MSNILPQGLNNQYTAKLLFKNGLLSATICDGISRFKRQVKNNSITHRQVFTATDHLTKLVKACTSQLKKARNMPEAIDKFHIYLRQMLPCGTVDLEVALSFFRFVNIFLDESTDLKSEHFYDLKDQMFEYLYTQYDHTYRDFGEKYLFSTYKNITYYAGKALMLIDKINLNQLLSNTLDTKITGMSNLLQSKLYQDDTRLDTLESVNAFIRDVSGDKYSFFTLIRNYSPAILKELEGFMAAKAATLIQELENGQSNFSFFGIDINVSISSDNTLNIKTI